MIIYLISEVVDLGTSPLKAYKNKDKAEEEYKRMNKEWRLEYIRNLYSNFGYTEEEAERLAPLCKYELDEVEVVE